ncbi:MAG TPA: LPP20 family lipoprotein [Gammaproteobacteria bacterium]
MRVSAFVLTAFVLVLSGCVTSGDKRADARPDWTDGASEAYPRNAWLTGIGIADQMGTARDRARADLAKTFRVTVDESTSDLRSYSQSGMGAASTTDYSSEIQRDLVTRTQQVLEGVTVPETWTDPSGRVYALAVLNRAKAAMRLRQEVSGLDAGAESLLARARATDDAFLKAKLAIDVVENQRKRAAAQSMLQAVDVTGRGIAPRWPLAELEADLATALSRIALRAEGNGDWKSIIAGQLADTGFSVVESGPYVATLSVEIVEMPKRQNWYWRRAVAVLDITGPGARSLGQQRWEFKESATDVGTVEFRLKEAIAGKLAQDVRGAVLGIVAN